MAKGSAPPGRKSVVQDSCDVLCCQPAHPILGFKSPSSQDWCSCDHGANGGIAGDDVWNINRTGRQVDMQVIDNHQIADIPIVTAGAVVKTQRGEGIIILLQYACTGKEKPIHSSGQLEWYKQEVDDRSI
jgi:hypothetical protein